MKKYGIYLAYPPTINLSGEGLGRHLMEFLKGAQIRGDLCFVIACPSWLREDLRQFFDAADIQSSCYEFIGPEKKPLFLTLYEKIKNIKRVARKSKLRVYIKVIKEKLQSLIFKLERTIISMRYTRFSLIFAVLALPLLFIYAAAHLITIGFSRLYGYARLYVEKRLKMSKHLTSRVTKLVDKPKSNVVVVKLYRLLLETETRLMLKDITLRSDVTAWYSPTAFWSGFNEIQAPKLVCVPDVVLSSFPIGFALIDEHNQYKETLKHVEKTIKETQHFVTYSEDVKWNTLVQRYHKNPASISVIKHGANKMDELIRVTGFKDNEASTDAFSRQLFSFALKKMVNQDIFYGNNRLFAKNKIQFLFYASQFRPNKNVISLLRAYNYLLKERFLGLKLVLTGDPRKFPEVEQFIKENNLIMDVFCLHRLSSQELAACYRLAELAVNPSLSEGGCPFTFTEALSVNTPVVMARIPVTEEVITCPDLRESMLFDPYDWRDIAHRIEWALKNKEDLLAQQKPFYETLAQRTWTHVVDDYINILEHISGAGVNNNKLLTDCV